MDKITVEELVDPNSPTWTHTETRLTLSWKGNLTFMHYLQHGLRMACIIKEDSAVLGRVGRTWIPVGIVVETPQGPVDFIGSGLSRYEWGLKHDPTPMQREMMKNENLKAVKVEI